jgi:carbamoyltransferase
MSVIVGLNSHHPDASACLLIDGKLAAAVAEERLGPRIKHTAGFPANALRSILKMGGIRIQDVDYVAFGHDDNANLSAKTRHVLSNPLKSAKAVAIHFQRRKKLGGLREIIADACGVAPEECRFELMMVEHHLAHLASSFFCSAFDQAAGFSYDGSGDFVSGMFARCEGRDIHVLSKVFVPHSLGFFYTAICQFIGFDRFGEEYKVMGLAAYGEPAYRDLMAKMVSNTSAGGYRLDPDFFNPVQKSFEQCIDERGEIVLPPLYSREVVRQLGEPRRRGAQLGQREKDLARSCQDHFEEVVIQSLRRLHDELGGPNLITAGGCALNGVCNARILRDTPFEQSYIQSAASDDGTAIGAALYVWHCVLGKPRTETIEHAYWGPEYSESELENALKSAGLPYRKYDRHALIRETVKHLLEGQVIGWYQGRSEWGPRALGNRSILAHPGWPGMKDLINRKIKRRESFRPFAPSILAEEVGNYFEQDIESPFMMHVVKIRPEKRTRLAAVCHEDHTGRLHSVTRAQNPLYYSLISEFFKKSETPVLLNTSFNENEPIVERPEHAIDCFRRTDIDALVIGPFITKKERPEK